MGQTGQPECPQCCSNLVPNRSTTIFRFLRKKAFLFKVFLGLLWPLLVNFWDPRPIFSHFLQKKAKHGLPICPLLGSQFVVPLPTQNLTYGLICMAKWLFSLYLGHLFPPSGHVWEILGLANGVNWSARMSSSPLHPHSNNVWWNRWPYIALIMIIPILAHFGSFWALGGPKYVKRPVLKLEQRSVYIMGSGKNTIDDSNWALSLNS